MSGFVTCFSGIVGLLALVVVGCSDGFSSGSCKESRSCTPAGGTEWQAGAPTGAGGVADDPDESRGGQGGDNGPVAVGGGGADPGVEPPEPCRADVDCSNDDATDGEELCEAGECKPGNAPPKVVSITPADEADEVEPDATIAVVFSEALDPDTISTDTFKVFAGEDEVTGTLKLATARDQLRFAPDQPLSLWATYRIEIASDVTDEAGVAMLDDVSSSFQVRDGVWSVKTLATANALELPRTLPVAPSGTLLATWLSTTSTDCGASGSWVLRGVPGAKFTSHRDELDCSHVSASIASDGSAIAAWAEAGAIWTQSFDGSSWAASDREGPAYEAGTLTNAQAFAHDAQHITLVVDSRDTTGHRKVRVGPAREAWSANDSAEFLMVGTQTATVSWDGGPLAWSSSKGIHVLGFDPKSNTWEAEATTLPGFVSSLIRRSILNVVTSDQGDAVIVWIEGSSDQVLRSSRFNPSTGWEEPINVTVGLAGEPLFDAPALVFDGETFVTAWTAATAGKWTTYSARYDLESGKWSQREPHVTELGESSILMPRLGVDSQRNLMLVWSIGDDARSLVYQRYRAETDTWGDVAAIPEGTFTDPDFATEGRLAFGFAKNGLGGVMFRSGSAGSQTLKLASFF